MDWTAIATFIVDNWDVIILIGAPILDVLFSSMDNSAVRYKGFVLRFVALVGDAAKAAADHDNQAQKEEQGKYLESHVGELKMARPEYFNSGE